MTINPDVLGHDGPLLVQLHVFLDLHKLSVWLPMLLQLEWRTFSVLETIVDSPYEIKLDESSRRNAAVRKLTMIASCVVGLGVDTDGAMRLVVSAVRGYGGS